MTTAVESATTARRASQDEPSASSCLGRFFKRIKNCLSKPETFMLAAAACYAAGAAVLFSASVFPLALPVGLALAGVGGLFNVVGLAMKAYQCRNKRRANQENANRTESTSAHTFYPLSFEPPAEFNEPHTPFRGIKYFFQNKTPFCINKSERQRQLDALKDCLSRLKPGDALMTTSMVQSMHAVITFRTSDGDYHSVSAADSFTPVKLSSTESFDDALKNLTKFATFNNAGTMLFSSNNAALIRGLDTEAMLEFVKERGGEYEFATLENNCSRFASDVLLAGVPKEYNRRFQHNRLWQMPLNAVSLAREINFYLHKSPRPKEVMPTLDEVLQGVSEEVIRELNVEIAKEDNQVNQN